MINEQKDHKQAFCTKIEAIIQAKRNLIAAKHNLLDYAKANFRLNRGGWKRMYRLLGRIDPKWNRTKVENIFYNFENTEKAFVPAPNQKDNNIPRQTVN